MESVGRGKTPCYSWILGAVIHQFLSSALQKNFVDMIEQKLLSAMISKTIREDFPILKREVNDDACLFRQCSLQRKSHVQSVKPSRNSHATHNANIHRGAATLLQEDRFLYEAARAEWNSINAKPVQKKCFLRGTTTSFKLLHKFALNRLQEGDEIWISPAEHHSNVVPWQQVANNRSRLRYFSLTKEGELDLEVLAEQAFNREGKIVSLTTHQTFLNGNGCEACRWNGSRSRRHPCCGWCSSSSCIKEWMFVADCDFYAFSDIRCLLQQALASYMGKQFFKRWTVEFGGEMIDFVCTTESAWSELAVEIRKQAPVSQGAIGLAAAIDYSEEIGWEYPSRSSLYLLPKMQEMEGVTVYVISGPENILESLVLPSRHPSTWRRTALDMEDLRFKSHHSTTLMRWLDVPATCRASFYIYNTLSKKQSCF